MYQVPFVFFNFEVSPIYENLRHLKLDDFVDQALEVTLAWSSFTMISFGPSIFRKVRTFRLPFVRPLKRRDFFTCNVRLGLASSRPNSLTRNLWVPNCMLCDGSEHFLTR